MEKENVKKPFYKKPWFLAVVIVVLLAAVLGSEEENNTSNETSPNIEVTENEAENEVLPENEEPDNVYEEKLVFELVAGECGDYGKLITYNEGTEFEENFYAYYVPMGTYVVTNIGNYRNQVNVYSDETVITEDGWEEVAEAFFVEVLDINESVTITVEEGQHVEIAEPSKFKFEQQ